MNILVIVIVASIVFLAMLGKHGWTPFMRMLLVLVLVPVALLCVAVISYQAPPLQASWTAFHPLSAAAPHWTEAALGIFDVQAQVRPPMGRGPTLTFLVFVVGLVGTVIVLQVRRGSWSWAGVMKAGAIAVGICLAIMIVRGWTSREASHQALLEARKAATEIEWVERQQGRSQPVAPTAMDLESESGQFRDVEVWRRESVLDWVSYSPGRAPSWYRDGLESEVVRLQDTKFISPLPAGRNWIAGYSSQHPEIEVAQNEAVAAAQRKLGIAALLQVKKAVPELDVRSLEEVATWLATARPVDLYTERATLERDQRPYGHVYRAAARVRADPPIIDALARRICKHVDAFGASPQPDLQVAFFGGMILVVLAFSAFLVYVFICAGSGGRWAALLRIVSGGMLATIVAAVIYLSVNLGAS